MDIAKVFYFALNKFLSSNASKILFFFNIWSGIENPTNRPQLWILGGTTLGVMWLQTMYKVYFMRT